jgi:hypothetical protein
MIGRRSPDRDTVLRIAREEAEAVNASLDCVLDMRRDRRARSARRAAMRRIIAETGCSKSGLAHVWGFDRQVVCRIFNPPKRRTPERRDRHRIARPSALNDLNHWRQLGQKRGAA